MNFAMKTTLASIVGLRLFSAPLIAEEKPQSDSRERELRSAQLLLEEWKQLDSLPEGVTIRVGSHMIGPKKQKEPAENKLPEEFIEHWEFSGNQVHRMELEFKNNDWVRRKAESRPCDAKKICQNLLEGKATEIPARKGTGDCRILVGTDYSLGGRAIEICGEKRRFYFLLNTVRVRVIPRQMPGPSRPSMRRWSCRPEKRSRRNNTSF